MRARLTTTTTTTQPSRSRGRVRIPSRRVSNGTTSVRVAAGLTNSRNQFTRVNERGPLTKWRQTIDGVPVYGSVVTTRSDNRG